MKWLIVNKFFDDVIGGVETVVSQHSELLLNDENEVTVLCCASSFQAFSTSTTLGKRRVVRCSTLGVIWGMPISFSFFFWFVKLTHQANNIELHYPFPLLDLGFLFVPKRRKYIVFWHSEIVRQKVVEWMLRPFTKKMLKHAKVITTSPAMISNSNYLRDLQPSDLNVLPLSMPKSTGTKVDVDFIIPEKYFLSLGRLSNYKGIDLLLDAVSNLRNELPFPLLLVGDGPLLEQIQVRIKNEGLSELVRLIPRFVSEDEKNLLFQNCEFFVLPSILPSEAFAITQLEALRNNKPVLNTKLNSGVPWVSVDGETGFSVEPNNVAALTTGVSKMIASYDMFDKQPLNRFTQLFEEEVVFSQIRLLYSSL